MAMGFNSLNFWRRLVIMTEILLIFITGGGIVQIKASALLVGAI